MKKIIFVSILIVLIIPFINAAYLGDNWDYTKTNWSYDCESIATAGTGFNLTVNSALNLSSATKRYGSSSCKVNNRLFANATLLDLYWNTPNTSIGFWINHTGDWSGQGDWMWYENGNYIVSASFSTTVLGYYFGGWQSTGVTMPKNEWDFIYVYHSTSTTHTVYLVRNNNGVVNQTTLNSANYAQGAGGSGQLAYAGTDVDFWDGMVVWQGDINSFPTTTTPIMYNISGSILYNTTSFTNISRVLLINDSNSSIIANTTTNSTGGYIFTNLANSTVYLLTSLFSNNSLSYTKSVYVNVTSTPITQNMDYFVTTASTSVSSVGCKIFATGCFMSTTIQSNGCYYVSRS